jgi:hypothetical protein
MFDISAQKFANYRIFLDRGKIKGPLYDFLLKPYKLLLNDVSR